MPELPEVETVRRSIEPIVTNAVVRSVQLLRPDIIRYGALSPDLRELFSRDRVSSLTRRGKQLAIIAASGRVLVIQLGMSGQLFLLPSDSTPPAKHVHCIWELVSPAGNVRLVFQDPRRFGGIYCFDSVDALHRNKWSELGPDALTVTADHLVEVFSRTHRALKAALLDQSILAGVGNIYADEALFRAQLHPRKLAHRCKPPEISRLAEAIRHVLAQSVKARGSTLRDYRDGFGEPGENQHLLLVYGHAGQPCSRCSTPLRSSQVAQRTTVHCPTCQVR
jgi:formamidopyrimidine-DNA glycosylase